jgi:hypothetical protein
LPTVFLLQLVPAPRYRRQLGARRQARMKFLRDLLVSRVSRATDALSRGDGSDAQGDTPLAANDGRSTSGQDIVQPSDADAGRCGTPAHDVQAWAPSFVSSMGAADAQQMLASAPWHAACAARHDDHRGIASDLPLDCLVAARLGAQLWAARKLPPGKSLHVVSVTSGKLVAVLNTRSLRLAVRQDLVSHDLDLLSTQTMPEAAATKPSGFYDDQLWDMIWQYGLHDRDALGEMPKEVAYQPLQLRRLPAVTPELLQPRHTTLLRLLMKDGLSFEQLLELTKTPGHQLCQDIAALVLTRSVRPV